MSLRILIKVLIIILAIAMIGVTTMVWYGASTAKEGEEDGLVKSPVAAIFQTEAGKNIITNQNPANNTLFCILNAGIEMPYIRVEYAADLEHVPFQLVAYIIAAAFGCRRSFGNPPARAAPEPRGPL